jgi:hypothetical protein
MRSLYIAPCVLIASTLAATQSAGPPQQHRAYIPNGTNSTVALEFVRLINNAELDQRMSAGKYVSFSKLVELGYLERVQSDTLGSFASVLGTKIKNETEPLPGWALSLIVSSDGESYSLSLGEQKKKCGLSFFSDNRGEVYKGKAVDCRVE